MQMKDKNHYLPALLEYLPLIAVFFLALLVRIVYNETAVRGYVPLEDANYYNLIARNLLEAHCYCIFLHHSTVSRAPLWPFIIAVIYFFAGEHSAYARLFFCFIGSGTCVLVYLLAKDLFGKRIALISGVIAAIYTGLFIWDGWLFAESLYTFCLTVFTYSLYRLQRSTLPLPAEPIAAAGNKFLTVLLRLRQQIGRHRWIILGGVFLALAGLTRPNGSGLFGLLFIWVMIVILARIMPWRTVVRAGLVIALIGIIIIAPWTYRNYTVSHAFVFISTGIGEVLVGVYNDRVFENDPNAYGLWRPPWNTLGHDAPNYTPANETLDIEHAFNWIRTHLSVMPYLLSLHLENMWKPVTFVHGFVTFVHGIPVMREFPTRPSARFVLSLMQTMPIPVYILAALGLVATLRRWKRLLVVYLVIVMTIAENVFLYGSMRFRSPIEPLLVLLAGGALWWLTCNEPGTLRYRFSGKKIVHEEAAVHEEAESESATVTS
jgi:4-amino-4-deoxy-L-arabinose transferase-like glycosyltransferase